MILYKSTRGEKSLLKFSDVIVQGIAADGGLYVPERIPAVNREILESMVGKSYVERAKVIFELFETDFPTGEIEEILNRAYSDNFDNEEIVPLVHLKKNIYMLELWHGPTSAFKDLALQLTPLLFKKAIEKKNNQNFLVLTATSGDTGKAALEGFKDIEGIKIIVFYPEGLVSKLQELQMVTQEGANLEVFGIKTDFDGVQKLVKQLFADRLFNKELESRNVYLSSANSINWGRLMPQIVYHFSAYLDLVKRGEIVLGDKVNIAVPTGNFGNIMAAFYAKKMGLPVNKLICASNENKVLSEFFETGVYDIKIRRLIKTHSPSMDILVASNIERLLYSIMGDTTKVQVLMKNLKEDGYFEISKEDLSELRKVISGGYVDNKKCLKTIRDLFLETGKVIDPHTAVAQTVAQEFIDKNGTDLKMIVCSTAHWAKFASDVYQGLFPERELMKDDFGVIHEIKGLSALISVPERISILVDNERLHSEVLDFDLEDIKVRIRNFLNNN